MKIEEAVTEDLRLEVEAFSTIILIKRIRLGKKTDKNW